MSNSMTFSGLRDFRFSTVHTTQFVSISAKLSVHSANFQHQSRRLKFFASGSNHRTKSGHVIPFIPKLIC